LAPQLVWTLWDGANGEERIDNNGEHDHRSDDTLRVDICGSQMHGDGHKMKKKDAVSQ
jgi:hypothetical protein